MGKSKGYPDKRDSRQSKKLDKPKGYMQDRMTEKKVESGGGYGK